MAKKSTAEVALRQFSTAQDTERKNQEYMSTAAQFAGVTEFELEDLVCNMVFTKGGNDLKIINLEIVRYIDEPPYQGAEDETRKPPFKHWKQAEHLWNEEARTHYYKWMEEPKGGPHLTYRLRKGGFEQGSRNDVTLKVPEFLKFIKGWAVKGKE